jgi:MFS family permease
VRAPARTAVALLLLCMGAATASWTVRLASIKTELHLGPGVLGLTLIGQPIGLFIAVRLAPALIRRFSSAAIARVAVALMALLILLPALAWNAASLGVGLVLLGLASGVSEVSVNVQAVAVEHAYAKPSMSGLHAMWSAGLLFGSLLASLAATANVSPREQLAVVGVLLAAVALVAGSKLLPETVEAALRAPEAVNEHAGNWQFLRQRALVIVALIGFCALLVEGSVTNWSSVYLHGSQGASYGVAALGVAVYSAAAGTGRLLGNGIIRRVGRIKVMRRSSLIAAVGMTVAIVAPTPLAALAGYGILGLGASTIVPTTFSLAGKLPGPPPAWSLSWVTTVGFSGSFFGPIAIGLLAGATGLRWALGVPVLMLIAIVPLTFLLHHRMPALEDEA